MQRYIAHVDMDAFFAAVEQRDKPYLRGKPVIVGADPKGGRGRGVVSTCSYEARRFSIRSGLPISTAYKLCPEAVFLPVDSEKYSRVSDEILEIFNQFTPLVEMISVDEAFLDISGSYHLFGGPLEACRRLKAKIKKETGLTASVGLAPIKMAAKIASDLEKPDGLVVVAQDKLLEFLHPLDIGKLWGLGKKTIPLLNQLGIKTIGQLATTDPENLTELLGKNGQHLWELANGIDQRLIVREDEIKSISNEITFDKDTSEAAEIDRALVYLSEKISSRMRRENFKARTITLKIRLQGFATYTRAMTLIKANSFVEVVYRAVKKLLNDFNRQGRKIRLLGVKVSNLMPLDVNDSLLVDSNDEKKERIHKTVDDLREKFGNQVIHRAGSIKK